MIGNHYRRKEHKFATATAVMIADQLGHTAAMVDASHTRDQERHLENGKST